ncbi:MAG: dipeptide/oligopeptide/nickel ABC transporter ATP-binding protein, partial [Eubacterium sp.]
MLLNVKNLNKSYKTQAILNDINFEIEQNEIFGLVGESGCGKSTLARLIARFEKPSAGEILYKEENVHHLKKETLKKFRRNCQMIFQDNLSSLDPSMKMMAALKEPLNNNYKMKETEKEAKIRALMEKVYLNEDILSRVPICISGGERQRINICRALMMSPELMICDEITSSLDVITQNRLLKLLKLLNQEMGMTILFISHDIDAVKSISDRVMVMEKGKMVEMLSSENRFAYKHPYTKKLFESLPISHPSQRQSCV